MELIEFFANFVIAVNEFISAIQWVFNTIIIIMNAFQGIWAFITSVLPRVYQLSQVVPMWLWTFPLAIVSWRLIVFAKSAGGD